MKMLAGIGMGLLLTAVAACSSSSDDGPTDGNPSAPATGATKDYAATDAAALCATLSTCPSSDPTALSELGNCVTAYQSIRLPPDCAQKLGALTCTSTAADIDPNECFPSCTGTAFSCDGPHLTQCSDGKQVTVDCNSICTNANATWTGVCGTSFGTQTESTPKCFCK